MEETKVAAIVPAYNEEKTVGGVVRALTQSGLFGDIIVVSDGSTDGTADAARRAGATLVHETKENRGKGAALGHGVMHTDAPVICFVDADLVGLTMEHLRDLLGPVIEGQRYMNVGLRDRGRFWTAVAARLPLIGGERAMRREIFEMIPDRYMSRFKVEIALDYFCAANMLPYGSAMLPGLGIVRKMRKVGVLRGLIGYVSMGLQLVWAMIEVRLARRQFVERGTHMSHRHR
jgi:glycosyltransferase involved in cell wall biosynthesis